MTHIAPGNLSFINKFKWNGSKSMQLNGIFEVKSDLLAYTYLILGPWLIKDQLRHMALDTCFANLNLQDTICHLLNFNGSPDFFVRPAGFFMSQMTRVRGRLAIAWNEKHWRKELNRGTTKRNGAWSKEAEEWSIWLAWIFLTTIMAKDVIPLHQLSAEWDRSPQQPFPFSRIWLNLWIWTSMWATNISHFSDEFFWPGFCDGCDSYLLTRLFGLDT